MLMFINGNGLFLVDLCVEGHLKNTIFFSLVRIDWIRDDDVMLSYPTHC